MKTNNYTIQESDDRKIQNYVNTLLREEDDLVLLEEGQKILEEGSMDKIKQWLKKRSDKKKKKKEAKRKKELKNRKWELYTNDKGWGCYSLSSGWFSGIDLEVGYIISKNKIDKPDHFYLMLYEYASRDEEEVEKFDLSFDDCKSRYDSFIKATNLKTNEVPQFPWNDLKKEYEKSLDQMKNARGKKARGRARGY